MDWLKNRDNRVIIIVAVIALLVLCGLCALCSMTGVSVWLINQLERDRPVYDDYIDQGLIIDDDDNGWVDGHYLTEVTFGEPFSLDGLEITFVDEVVFEDSERGVFLVPVIVRNTTESAIDLADIAFSQRSPATYYLEDEGALFPGSFSVAGTVRPHEVLPTFFPFNDEGDGDYLVEFTHSFPEGTMETIMITLPIAR
jgi:hypothetical protein